MLNLGHRWKIGDGSQINVWSMSWIRNLPSLKPSTQLLPNYEDLTVNSLLNPSLNSRNISLVQAFFNASDIAAILTTPLFGRASNDCCIWKTTVDESSTVKSAYNICSNLLHVVVPTRSYVNLYFICHMRVPPQVRSFIWCTTHQCLPTRVILLHRGIPSDDTCVSCNRLAESLMHVFFVCSKATSCWELIGIHSIVHKLLQIANDFTAMFFELFNRLQSQQQILVAMTLWSLWKSRSTKLWKAYDTTPSSIVTRAKYTLNEWSCMQRAKLPLHEAEAFHNWSKPPTGMIKCNVDTAAFNNNTVLGNCMCFRDTKGLLLLGKSDYFHSSTTFL